MPHNLGIGIEQLQLLQQLDERCFLPLSASVGRSPLGIQSAFVAYADAVGVVAPGMGTHLGGWTARIDGSILADVEMVADVAPVILCHVTVAQGFQGEVLGGSGRRAVDNDQVDFSHFRNAEW